MRLYLDNCMFNRPFDDQSSIRVRLEAETKLNIQENIRLGNHELVWSYILDYENLKNPFQERRDQIGKWKRYAKIDVSATDGIVRNAKALNVLGLKAFDALHIACAISARADYFLTTDRGIIRKTDAIPETKVRNPIDFIQEATP
ncbi:hypothetical protein JKG47_05070 [Acidithiobacillus sp. MC6.1]|nr:hypothetical protein [Acidithiobacillus sp. MC6.1]